MLFPRQVPTIQTASSFSRSFRGRVTLCRSGRHESRKWNIPITCRNSGTVVGAGMSRIAAEYLFGSAKIPSGEPVTQELELIFFYFPEVFEC